MEAAARRTGSEASGFRFAVQPVIPSHSRSFPVIPGVSPAPLSRRGYSRDAEGSWFRSLFVHKVDPRKDAHSNLLSKKETSNLYKIQCECSCRQAQMGCTPPCCPSSPIGTAIPGSFSFLPPSPAPLLSLQFTT